MALCMHILGLRFEKTRSLVGTLQLNVIEIYVAFEKTRSLRIGSAALGPLCDFGAMCVLVASKLFLVLRRETFAYRAPVLFGDMPSCRAPVLPREMTHAQRVHVAHGSLTLAKKLARFLALC